jgi:uncharacterized protein YndB with AHSA1/START domain
LAHGILEKVVTSHMVQALEQSQVEVSTRIFAEIRRVFYALTIPEYLEAWICFPGCKPFERVAVTQSAKDFVIELKPLEPVAADTRIKGAHLVREPNQIVFTWSKQYNGQATETTVCIHLHRSHRSTALSLSHMGFVDPAERMWHEAMWRASFDKLGHLLN